MGQFDPMCAGDVSPPGGNGVRNIDDLVEVLHNFGACANCSADILPVNAPNGNVTIDEILHVINNWGACSG